MPEKAVVTVAATQCNLGPLSPTALATASFTVGNTGNRRLIIREDRCSGCGQAEWIIEPGGTDNLTIPFDATGLQGSVRQVRHFTTNDPALPRLTLTVVAIVGDSSATNDN
jgi:hypothetical protein